MGRKKLNVFTEFKCDSYLCRLLFDGTYCVDFRVERREVITTIFQIGEPGSSVSIVSGYGQDFSCSLCPDRLWGLPGLLYNGYRGPFPGAWRWPLTAIYCRGQEWVGAITPPFPGACVSCSRTALAFIFQIAYRSVRTGKCRRGSHKCFIRLFQRTIILVWSCLYIVLCACARTCVLWTSS
jgi:hypothetical protein